MALQIVAAELTWIIIKRPTGGKAGVSRGESS
jgi:hypothetical protein